MATEKTGDGMMQHITCTWSAAAGAGSYGKGSQSSRPAKQHILVLGTRRLAD